MSSSGNGGRSAPPSQDCNSLAINTHIASPVASVIGSLSPNDLLDVILTSPRGPVQLQTRNGSIAGSVITTDIDNLIQCISDGHQYRAKVVSIKGGNCQVSIRHI